MLSVGYVALQNQSSTQEAAEQTHTVYTGKHTRIFNVFTLYYFLSYPYIINILIQLLQENIYNLRKANVWPSPWHREITRHIMLLGCALVFFYIFNQ
jgi:hypothetical protein